jgi:hypothetical protein
MAELIKWDNADFKWEDNPHLWDLVEIISDITSASGEVIPVKLEKLDKKKKKKLVHLIMHRNGIKIYDEKKEVKNLHLKVKDIEIIAEEIKKHVQIIY